MNKLLKKLGEFIATERNRFETRHNNMFAFSFYDVSRYFEFLLVISERHTRLSSEYLDLLKTFQKTVEKSAGSHTMSAEQMRIDAEMTQHGIWVQLEVESFYLFAKILLDEIARAIEFYFGQSKGLSFDSHDSLVKDFSKFIAVKHLESTDELNKAIKTLKSDVADFRDYQISHHKNPRTVRGTSGDGRMLLTQIYPKPGDEQKESKLISELLGEIENYIELVMDFVESNKEKSNLELKKI